MKKKWYVAPFFLVALAALAVEPTPEVLAVAAYKGAERTGRLIAGAKKEGELLLYSSLTQDDQLRLAAFSPRILDFWRSLRSLRARMVETVCGYSESKCG